MKDILITSSVLILAILLIRTLFRVSISRRMQYALWLLAALRLLIPFNLAPAGYSVLNTAQWMETQDYRALQTVPALQLTRGTVRGYDDRAIIPENPVSAQSDTEPVKPEQAQAAFDIRRCVRPVWYGGMVVMAVWFLSANLRFARKLRRTRIPLESVKSRNPVYLCDDVPAPCLFGLIHPVIYVTSAAARDRASLECVIAHEETHAKHLDPLWSLIRIVCLVIYWFDPLVWLAAHCSRVDSELACDEGTIARLGESERMFYGRTLLALVPVRRGGSPILAATTMISGKRHMRDRIRRIAEYKRPAAAALVIALLLSGAAFAATFTGAESVISDKTGTEEQMLSIAQEMAASLIRRFSDRCLLAYDTSEEDVYQRRDP